MRRMAHGAATIPAMRLALGLLVLPLAILPACSTSRIPVGDVDAGAGGTDAGPRTDSGGPRDDGGPAPVDAARPDGGPRPDAGQPDGGTCECPPPPEGCRYVGSPCPCDELECDALDAGGPAAICGGFVGATCDSGQFCDYADPHSCGGADETGVCQPRPIACTRLFDPHCGCDGATYSNACVAHAAGVDTAYRGECATRPECVPDDARGEGLCDAIVGYAWDGTSCRWLSGCGCVGRDCGRYASYEECEAIHAGCGSTDPPPPPRP